jgi:transcriptional regulator with XRE-family HTH domain
LAPRPSKPVDKTSYRGRLASNIRKRREDLGLSVAEVEARLEAAGTPISLHALYKYETSERPVTADDLPALAKALETTIHKLVPAK